MTDRYSIALTSESLRPKLTEAARRCPVGWSVEFRKDKRTLDQNAKMWAMFQDLADQVVWHGVKLTKENWKDVLTAALKNQDVVPGIEGGFVALGHSTRAFTKEELSMLIELTFAFGAQQGVKWTDPVERP
jgi:hypothetical protein